MSTENPSWYKITQRNEAILDVSITDEIGSKGISARQFLNEIRPHAKRHIIFHINSPGGILIDAFAIYDFVKLQGYHASAYIHGIASSAASVVATCAKECLIGEHSYLFIHNPYFAGGKNGSKADLDRLRNDLLDIYHRKTGLDKKRISDMMDAETLLSANESLEFGFVDGIVRERVFEIDYEKNLDSLNNPELANTLSYRLGLGHIGKPINDKPANKRNGWEYLVKYLQNKFG